jgi:hypothetical protein
MKKTQPKKTKFLTVLLGIGFVPLFIALTLSTIVSISSTKKELLNDTYDLLSVYAGSVNRGFGVYWS